jgi:hypothetical protein
MAQEDAETEEDLFIIILSGVGLSPLGTAASPR